MGRLKKAAREAPPHVVKRGKKVWRSADDFVDVINAEKRRRRTWSVAKRRRKTQKGGGQRTFDS